MNRKEAGMDFDKMRFSAEHEWVRPTEGSNDEVVIGITEYAAGELGDIVFVELPEVGAEIQESESVGTIEAVKTVADIYAPVSGTVTDVNREIEDKPDIVNSSPYEAGWFFKIALSDPAGLEKLMTHDAYQEMIGEA
jgi:glycine cleavage system H protein